jgi:transaldolase
VNNPLQQLREHGQSVWLDNLTRVMIEDGSLERLIREDGLSGITSNPKTFHGAISGSDAYDRQIRELAGRGITSEQVFEELAVRDVRDACDLLRPVYDETGGNDGFVSLEVSPRLARRAQATIDEALRLWKRVDRPNVLIKIPGTKEGLTAIWTCLAEGVNVNITLLFSLERYGHVVAAWWQAMETRRRRGLPPVVKSVASFFLSRIDAKVDPLLDEIAASGGDGSGAATLRGRTAIASAKLAYELWKQRFAEPNPAWATLHDAGIAPQRLLWASTSTKDPAYDDGKYVEALIGPRTVNTMPEHTLAAFRDHGSVASTLERDLDEQRSVLTRLDEYGVDLDRVTNELEEEGIAKFVEPFDAAVEALGEKIRALAGTEAGKEA